MSSSSAFRFLTSNRRNSAPAVVVSSAAYNVGHPDLIIMAITSRSGAQTGRWDVRLQDWTEAGLLKDSWLKPVLAAIRRALVRRALGRLSDGDLAGLRSLLRRILGDDQGA